MALPAELPEGQIGKPELPFFQFQDSFYFFRRRRSTRNLSRRLLCWPFNERISKLHKEKSSMPMS